MINRSSRSVRYPIALLYSLATLSIAAGFCSLLLLTILSYLDTESVLSETKVETEVTHSINHPTIVRFESPRLETSGSMNSLDIKTDVENLSTRFPRDTDASNDGETIEFATPTVLSNIEEPTDIFPLTKEIASAVLVADYQSLIASGKTTSEAIRIVDQHVSAGKYGVMGNRPTTLEVAKEIFLADYDRLMSTGVKVDEVLRQLMENVPTGRYGIYSDILFQSLEESLIR